MQSVLVTGAGFVGNALINALKSRGISVVGVARHPRGADVVVGDAGDWQFMLKLMLEHNVDTVFHLAADATVAQVHSMPYESALNNVRAVLGVLEAVRRYGKARVVVLGTDKEYGEVEDADEDAPVARNSGVYGASKLAATFLALAYRQEFGLDVTVARSVNIYGPGDTNLTRIVPKAIWSFMKGVPFTLYVPTGKRAYIYIDDLVNALITIAEKGRDYPVINVCSRDVKSSDEVVKEILKYFPNGVVKEVPSPYPEIRSQSLRCDKLKSLGWQQTVSFEEGIRRTVEWWLKTKPLG
ncbi:MAG: NAD(P)-dependent oxidoreductase [Vulcanisaeta sp.]|nr:NAD(P)-dependent oxidoreductase [Vulcanisaeta sp.]